LEHHPKFGTKSRNVRGEEKRKFEEGGGNSNQSAFCRVSGQTGATNIHPDGKLGDHLNQGESKRQWKEMYVLNETKVTRVKCDNQHLL